MAELAFMGRVIHDYSSCVPNKFSPRTGGDRIFTNYYPVPPNPPVKIGWVPVVAVTGTEIRPIYLRTGTFGSYQYIESAYTESVPVGYEIATGEAVEWYVNITGLSGVWYAYNVEPKQLVYLRNYGSNPALQGYAYFGSGSVVQPIQPKNWYRASVPPTSFLELLA